MCTPENRSGIAGVSNVFLVRANNEDEAHQKALKESGYVKHTKFDCYDVGKELQDKDSWSLYY